MKRVSLVCKATVRTRLTMSFPDPLNPRTYFYKAPWHAALQSVAALTCLRRAHSHFSKLWHERLPNFFSPLPPFLISLKLNLWWNASTSWPPLTILLHPSFLWLAASHPQPPGFLPQTVFETRTSPSISPAHPRLPPVRAGYCSFVDALSCSSSPQRLQRDAARCFDTVRWPHSQRAGGSFLRGGVIQKVKYSNQMLTLH